MQKLVFVAIVALGASLGLLSAANDNGATLMVMAAIGALFAAPVGAVLSRWRKHDVATPFQEDPVESSVATSPRALVSNYWRDKGHPPFMNPPEAEPDKHMFDPDKLS